MDKIADEEVKKVLIDQSRKVQILMNVYQNQYLCKQQYCYPLKFPMNEQKTLNKCRKIMEMFDKSKPSSALKQRSNNVHGSSKKGGVEHRGVSFYLPNKNKVRSFDNSNSKLSFNNSNSSLISAKKSCKSIRSPCQANFQSVYNKESRYDKIMKLKVKPVVERKQKTKNSYLSSSKTSLNSSFSSLQKSNSKQLESRLDKIMKLKVHKPKVDSTLKNYEAPKNERKMSVKQNLNENNVLELKKCKQIIKKQEKQTEKQDRLWKAFEREREQRLKQKQKRQRNNYQRERSFEKRFDLLVQKELKKIEFQKEIGDRKQKGFSSYLFPSY